MKDSFSRNIDYMRISITDRCNMKCPYCRPEDIPFIPHDKILRYEEILRVCKIMVAQGIKVIRVTGGEPLLREGCIDFLKSLKSIPQTPRVTLTTNGMLLKKYIKELHELQLDGLNVSLDTLSPELYKSMTGVDGLSQVLEAIHQALSLDIPVKVNCVPVKGLNDQEIIKMANLARELPIDVRFIELMPSSESSALQGVSSEEVYEVIAQEYPDLSYDETLRGFGPARYYKSQAMQGSVGVISAISDSFCSKCNRLRLTSEGYLKFCLHHDLGIDLREMLRNGESDDVIAQMIKANIQKKPEKHLLQEETSLKHMSRIGG